MDNKNGNSQYPAPVVRGDNSMNVPAPPVYLQQTSALNVFMMGQGQASVSVGYYSPTPNAATPGNAWNTTANFQSIPQELVFQQVQRQEQQPSTGPTATGTTVPQSGYVKDLKLIRNSSAGNATNGNKPGSDVGSSNGSESSGRVTRSKSKKVTFFYQPPEEDLFSSIGNSPQGQQGGSNGGDRSPNSD